ncbi:MAG TPA: HAD family phosphatase [Clostridiaceae bacterium]|nr:HAD family phosphatase [Clostridiaceae bacterium]
MKWTERKFKLIACDVDGTLVPEGENELDPRFFEIFRLMQEKGILFSFVSGRQYRDLTSLAPDSNQEIIFVAANGSVVIEKDEIITEIPLTNPDPLLICHDINQFDDTDYFVSTVNNFYANPRDQETRDWMSEVPGSIFIDKIEDLENIKDSIVKVSLQSNHENGADEYLHCFKEKWGHLCQVERSGYGWVDFTNSDKGAALSKLSALKNFDMDDVMAFGDNSNDQTMLRLAGFSAAMADSAPEVQADADIVVEDLYQYLLDYLNN